MFFRPIQSILAVLAVATVAACSRNAEQPKTPLGQANTTQQESPSRLALPAEARAALDSGNAEFRAKRYDAALAQYRTAAKVAPNDAAAYYGIFMAAQKLNNAGLADSANKQIARLAGSQPGLSDSALRAVHAAGASAPKAH